MDIKNSVTKLRDFYTQKKDAPFVQREFGYYCIEKWISEGHITDDMDLNRLFGYDLPVKHSLGQLGWCEAPFYPCFEEKVLEDRGEYELVQDFAGRHVLYFKGRRNGFMPEYVDHPVKDMHIWEKDVKWRLNYDTPERLKDIEASIKTAKEAEKKGFIICLSSIGGYMYLRSLMGPEGALYMFYDEPDLVHDCMKTWFELADKTAANFQKYVTVDEVFLAEDICYNKGPLISPDMVREFLFPYYQQFITNIRKRQMDKNRHLHIQIDTDGDCRPVIQLYKEIGMDFMSPFEVASGCDVVEARKQYPELLISGGVDKRILSESKDEIDKELDRIMPFMRKHGGYIPTCDHGVPEEVSFENYMHFRKRMLEYGG